MTKENTVSKTLKGVPASKKYSITKHAYSRIQERYFIRDEWVKPWVTDLMNSAVFIKNSMENGRKRQLWDAGGIRLIIEPSKLSLITVFSVDDSAIPISEKDETELGGHAKLLPELVSALNSCLDLYDIKTFKRHSQRLVESETLLADLHGKVVNTSTHDYIRKQREQIMYVEKFINGENNSYQTILDSINKAKRLLSN